MLPTTVRKHYICLQREGHIKKTTWKPPFSKGAQVPAVSTKGWEGQRAVRHQGCWTLRYHQANDPEGGGGWHISLWWAIQSLGTTLSSVFTDEKEVYKTVSITAPLTSPAHARLPTPPTLKLVCPHRGCKSQALATLLSSSCLILNC